jgi:hypothetical protein
MPCLSAALKPSRPLKYTCETQGIDSCVGLRVELKRGRVRGRWW